MVRERRAPHAPQVDVLMAADATHDKVADSCVNCHVQKAHGGGGHTFRAKGRADEAKVLRAEIEPLLDAARERLSTRVKSLRACGGKNRGAGIAARGQFLIVVSASGHDLGDCDADGKIAGAEKSFVVPDDSLAGDAYDYFLLQRDRSFGYHNPAFARTTLARIAGKSSAEAAGPR
jgi:hypothetical protein